MANGHFFYFMGFMKESEIISRLTEIANPVCEELGAFLVEIIVLSGKKKSIEIVVQSDDGVKSQDIVAISREINKRTEEIEFFEDPYQIEVGSPGIGRPIKMIRALNSQIGRLLDIEFKKETGKQSVKGNLKAINGQILSVEVKSKKESIIHEINFDDIKSVSVDVEW